MTQILKPKLPNGVTVQGFEGANAIVEEFKTMNTSKVPIRYAPGAKHFAKSYLEFCEVLDAEIVNSPLDTDQRIALFGIYKLRQD